ncbi:hypothetical protein DFH09DRAFT_1085610 [Mycena vulgaris]|nr:hypothetical protein DFH09DRAFT_1085610 [Mycena vulgaris]
MWRRDEVGLRGPAMGAISSRFRDATGDSARSDWWGSFGRSSGPCGDEGVVGQRRRSAPGNESFEFVRKLDRPHILRRIDAGRESAALARDDKKEKVKKESCWPVDDQGLVMLGSAAEDDWTMFSSFPLHSAGAGSAVYGILNAGVVLRARYMWRCVGGDDYIFIEEGKTGTVAALSRLSVRRGMVRVIHGGSASAERCKGLRCERAEVCRLGMARRVQNARLTNAETGSGRAGDCGYMDGADERSVQNAGGYRHRDEVVGGREKNAAVCAGFSANLLPLRSRITRRLDDVGKQPAVALVDARGASPWDLGRLLKRWGNEKEETSVEEMGEIRRGYLDNREMGNKTITNAKTQKKSTEPETKSLRLTGSILNLRGVHHDPSTRESKGYHATTLIVNACRC